MELTSTSSMKVNYIRAIVDGVSGAGKTYLFRTLPEKSTLICAAERGLLSLRGTNFPVVRVTSWQDMRDLVSAILKAEKTQTDPAAGLDIDIGGAVVHGIKTLGVDSITEISSMCIRHIVEVDKAALMAGRAGAGKEHRQLVHEDIMELEDWNLYNTRMANLLAALIRLPLHLICTALVTWKEVKSPSGATLTIQMPDVQGRKFPASIPAGFDLLFSLEQVQNEEGQTVRALRTQPSSTVMAKGVDGLAPWEPADWSVIFRKVLAAVGTGTGADTDGSKKASKKDAKSEANESKSETSDNREGGVA